MNPVELLKEIAKTDATTEKMIFKTPKLFSYRTSGTKVHFIENAVHVNENYSVFTLLYNNAIICIPKKNLENNKCKDTKEPICVISSHIDTVKHKLPEVTENGDTLIGYFDNSACNAACLSLMEYAPENTIFVFTGGEEHYNCVGLQIAYFCLTKELGFSPEQIYGIATDVTYEGYLISDCALTIENMSGKKYVSDKQIMLNNVYTVGDRRKVFKSLPHIPHRTLPDEGWMWSRLNSNISFSACLPVGEGDMHSKKNLTHLNKKTYEAYIGALYNLSIQIRGKVPEKSDIEILNNDDLSPSRTKALKKLTENKTDDFDKYETNPLNI